MHILHLSDTPVNCSVFANITEVSSALCVKDTFETYGQCRFCNGNVPVNRSVFANISEVWRSLQTTSDLTSGLCLENII